MFNRYQEDCDHLLHCGGVEFGYNELNSESWFSVVHVENSCAVTVVENFEPSSLHHAVVTIHPNLFPSVSLGLTLLEIRFDDLACYKEFCRFFGIKPCQKVLREMES
ncbi:TPA: hypothetical protein KD863_004714 [Vibrio parahaemolyticus]|nr:hypothetical protein [Vibrio parahaemolyticus]